MKLKYLFTLFFITICLYLSYSQIVYNDKLPYNSLESTKQIIDSAFSIQKKLNSGRIDIFEKGNKYYLTVDGTFLVFKWEYNRWNNLYTNQYTGYNIYSRKFIYNDKIYSFGGYGFWRFHGQLIWFVEKKGEWEIVPGTENLMNGYSILEDSILCVFNSHENYTINLNNHDINYLNSKIPPEYEKNIHHIAHDMASTSCWISAIINLKDKKLYFSYLDSFKGIKKSYVEKGLMHITGHTISHYTHDYQLFETDIYADDFKLFEYIPILSTLKFKVLYFSIYVALISIIGFIFYLTKRKKRAKKTLETPSIAPLEDNTEVLVPYHPLIHKLLSYNSLTQEELDVLLEIDHVQPEESKKFKRSQLIKELNTQHQIKTGVLLIEREKDITDRRRFIYNIRKI